MVQYKVTLEIKTTWWEKLLRWFKLYPKLTTFELVFGGDYYKIGEILSVGENEIKILEKL